MAVTKGMEIPSIDCVLVTLKVEGETDELAIDTASKVSVEVLSETTEAQKLIVKGVLKAQKQEVTTVTGNKITLSDNLFIPQLVQIMQGGTITKEEVTGKITGYKPPLAGSSEKGKIFILNCYSAIYNSAGIVTGYEKIAYPNCQGTPIAFNTEDNVFRAPEYVINSAPAKGEAPYDITYVEQLPAVTEYKPSVG